MITGATPRCLKEQHASVRAYDATYLYNKKKSGEQRGKKEKEKKGGTWEA